MKTNLILIGKQIMHIKGNQNITTKMVRHGIRVEDSSDLTKNGVAKFSQWRVFG